MNITLSNAGPGKGLSHATVFVWLFAVAAIWHYTSSSTDIASYWFRYDPLVTPLVFLSIATAFIAAVFPAKTFALLLFAGGQLLAIVLRFPHVADHLVMELFLNLSILLSFAYLAVKRRTFNVTTEDMFALFSPVGRWLLIIMYFFGTFHKINPGFMTPLSSCAVPFIEGFPLPQALLDQSWLQYAAIYGTLILESIAMLLLLSARTKYFGMLLGMSFHFIIGISGFGTLAHFSAFALTLHTLFLPSGFGERIYQDPLVPEFIRKPGAFQALTIGLIVLQVVLALHLGITRQVYLVNALFGTFALILMYLVFKHGQMQKTDAPYRLKSSLVPLNLIPVWFFVHCLSPYIGLGTGGTIAMFSGLRTEGGISNHYLVRKPPYLFPYQQKVVHILSATNPSLQAAAADGQGLVMFDFQRHFTQRENLLLPLTLRIDDVTYELNSLDAAQAFINEHFEEQSWLARKYMSFRLVDDPRPNRCRH